MTLAARGGSLASGSAGSVPPQPQRLWALLMQDSFCGQGGSLRLPSVAWMSEEATECPDSPSVRGTIHVLQPAPHMAAICTESRWLTEESSSIS